MPCNIWDNKILIIICYLSDIQLKWVSYILCGDPGHRVYLDSFKLARKDVSLVSRGGRGEFHESGSNNRVIVWHQIVDARMMNGRNVALVESSMLAFSKSVKYFRWCNLSNTYFVVQTIESIFIHVHDCPT